MRALGAAARKGFLARLAVRLKQDYPAEMASLDGVPADVLAAWVDEAASFGVMRVGDVERYLEIKLATRGAFPRAARFAPHLALLEDAILDAAAKLDRIDDLMLFAREEMDVPDQTPA